MPKILKVRKHKTSRQSSKQPAKTQRSKTPSSSSTKPRSVSAPSKSPVKKSDAQLKAEIEKLLGEDFESLAEAQKALKRESEPAEKLPNKFFKIKKLTKRSHKNLAEVMEEIEENPDKIDALKEPEEYWGLRMFGNRSYMVFTHIEDLLARIREYKSFEQSGKGHGDTAQEYLDNVYLIKYEGSPANWAGLKKEEKAEAAEFYKKKKQREKQREKNLVKREAKVAAREKRVQKRESKLKQSKGSKVGKSKITKGK